MRRMIDRAFGIFAVTCAAGTASVALGVVGWIAFQGAGALSWEFLTQASAGAGTEGGVFYQIVGTVILIASALLFAIPAAIGIALMHSVYFAGRAWRGALTGTLHLLNAAPSILFGILGFLFFVLFLDWGKSWLAGGAVLAMMILPTLTLALVKGIEAIPARQIEAAAGLGLRRAGIVAAVILPQSARSLLTGSLLGLARAAGETAPILFVAAAFSGADWPDGIRENPVLALPYHIFVLAQDSFDPAAQQQLWGAALVLVLLVAGLSLAALPLRLKSQSSHADF